MEISQLDLAVSARAAATLLKTAFPQIVFTSGRRGVADQARAMASNVQHNRRWIEQTYMRTPERAMLQAWIDTHPAADTREEIRAGFVEIMLGWNDTQKGRLSKHFSGQAFDVQPLPAGTTADAVKTAIRALPRLEKFLEKEGGLIRWHAQFLA